MYSIKVEPFNQTRFGEYMTRTVDRYQEAGLPYDHPIMNLLDLEFNGGNCPRCGTPWKEIHVENTAADFIYYDPACKCFSRCPRCKGSLHREESTGGRAHRCNSCGWEADRRTVSEVECDECHHWFSFERRRRNLSNEHDMEVRYERLICPECLAPSRKRSAPPRKAS